MAIYDPKSRVAEEFINDQEIRDTLAYAEEHKSDVPLLMSILDKAAQFKGLTHREAAVLLACDVKEVNDRIFETAIKVKEHIYGSRIVLFAPLYLSNYCVNTCTYCQANAIMTMKEYMCDYASKETREAGERVIANELPKIPHEKIRIASEKRLIRIADGERDFRF